LKRFTDEEALEFIRSDRDGRWTFAIMEGPDGGRWLIGSRCDVVMPLFSLDACPHESIYDAFHAVLDSPMWDIYAWQAGHSGEFEEASEKTYKRIEALRKQS
jgi:hypothetical protein